MYTELRECGAKVNARSISLLLEYDGDAAGRDLAAGERLMQEKYTAREARVGCYKMSPKVLKAQ